MVWAVLSHLWGYFPAYNEYPLEKARARAESYVKTLTHTRTAQQKAIASLEDYRQKVAQPALEAYIKFLSPEFVSQAGWTAEQLISRMREKLFSELAYREYGRDLALQRITDKLPLKTVAYAVKKTFGA